MNTPGSSGSAAFLEWLDQWYDGLAPASLRETVLADGAEKVAVIVVDLLVGFCSEGALANPRVNALGPMAAAFLRDAWDAGVRHLVFASDAHPENSLEFRSFPPHCIRGTREAEVIEVLRELPFFDQAIHLEKGSLSVGQEPSLSAWQDRHPEVTTFVIIGDCTDLCVYHTAMHLQLQAISLGHEAAIYVPAELVDTYDLPVEVAQGIGALPHDGDLLHRLFLYHMALNGVRVVRALTP